MKLLTAAEMRELDRRTIEEVGLPGVVLMENAGPRRRRPGAATASPPLLRGRSWCWPARGTTAGTAIVIARWLRQYGWQARTVVLAAADGIGGDAAHQPAGPARQRRRDRLRPGRGASRRWLWRRAAEVRLLVDALLGTGLSAEVRGLYARAIDWINASGRPVVAVDIPSGIDAGTGAVLGRAVRADLTITFGGAKVGQAVYPGAEHVGKLAVVDIGIPVALAGIRGGPASPGRCRRSGRPAGAAPGGRAQGDLRPPAGDCGVGRQDRGGGHGGGRRAARRRRPGDRRLPGLHPGSAGGQVDGGDDRSAAGAGDALSLRRCRRSKPSGRERRRWPSAPAWDRRMRRSLLSAVW